MECKFDYEGYFLVGEVDLPGFGLVPFLIPLDLNLWPFMFDSDVQLRFHPFK